MLLCSVHCATVLIYIYYVLTFTHVPIFCYSLLIYLYFYLPTYFIVFSSNVSGVCCHVYVHGRCVYRRIRPGNTQPVPDRQRVPEVHVLPTS